MSWAPPNITLRWGDYFKPDAEDDDKTIKSTLAAHDGGLITKRSAVQKIQRTFSIENVDQYLLTLAEEAQEKADALTKAMHAMGGPDDNQPPVKKPNVPDAEL